MKIQIELPDEIAEQLRRLAAACGVPSVEEAATIAIGQWVARSREQLDRSDPAQAYFVNQALDELIAKQRK
ncbi:MAG: ribbon-helix-helix protein, CopG family [Candidatus Binataceae bacterium]|nr:ribbon-helix-helix protein, CopG family [Candidatus Binataceae bacterium]